MSLGPNTLVRAWFVIWDKLSHFGNSQIIPKSLSPPYSTRMSSLMSSQVECGLLLFIAVHSEIFGNRAWEMDDPGAAAYDCTNCEAHQCHHKTVLIATIKANLERRAFLTFPFSSN